VITYDGVPTYSVSVMELTGDLVTHETQVPVHLLKVHQFRHQPAH